MKIICRVLCTVLLCAMLLSSLASCGIIKGDTVMEYEDYKITEAMYSYWAASFKSYFLYYYGGSSGYDKLWSQKLPDGRTYGEFFYDYLDGYAKKVLVCMKLFDKYALKFPDSARDQINERLDELKKTYGGKAELNAYLSDYGINIKTLEKIYYEEAKVDVVTEYIFSEKGPLAITDEKREAYYKDNYYCVNWIYIYTEKKPDDENAGTDSDGNFLMKDLTDEEKAEKANLVSDIMEKLQSGTSFASLKAQYCEDKNSDGSSKYDYYPNGFNLSANSYADGYGADLIKLIQSMEIGGYATYKDEYATRIIVRNPLVEFSSLTAQEFSFMVDFESYVTDHYMDIYLDGINITVDTEVRDRYKVENIKTINMGV